MNARSMNRTESKNTSYQQNKIMSNSILLNIKLVDGNGTTRNTTLSPYHIHTYNKHEQPPVNVTM